MARHYVSRGAPLLVLAMLLGVPPAAASDHAPVHAHAIALSEVRMTESGTASIVVRNTGDLPLRDVAVTWVTSPQAAVTFDPPTISLLRAGDVRRLAVRGVAPGRALVTVGDRAGWARASRTIEGGSRPNTVMGLRLSVGAARVIEVARPSSLRFTVERPAPGGKSTRPAARLVLSILLPKGVRSVDGKKHFSLDMPAAPPGGDRRHRFARVRIVAERSGPFRVRAVVRDLNGRASAGVLLDLEAEPAGGARHALRHDEPKGDASEDPADDLDGKEKASRGRPPSPSVAVDDAAAWLVAHQSPHGGWEAAGFGTWCDRRAVKDPRRQPGGRGNAAFDAGVTGLALLALLVVDASRDGPRRHAKSVSLGIRHLRGLQDEEGCFGARTHSKYIYNHAVASLAMLEAYRATELLLYRKSAQRALDFIALARNPYSAWRYGVKPGDNDTSVTGWMVTVLYMASDINADAQRRGKAAPFTIDQRSADGIRTWLDRVTDPDYGRVGYLQRGKAPSRPPDLLERFPGEQSESMTAVGVFARVVTREDARTSKLIKRGVALCSKLPPRWDASGGSIDMIYWHFGTLAMHVVGGKPWQAWRLAMQTCALASQRRDTDTCLYKGSWDPVGPWGRDGGRVYATALMALSLQISLLE